MDQVIVFDVFFFKEDINVKYRLCEASVFWHEPVFVWYINTGLAKLAKCVSIVSRLRLWNQRHFVLHDSTFLK